MALVVVGALVIPKMDLGWFTTPEVNQKNLNDLANKGVQSATGYTPAKTPSEAMDLFQEAIQKRKYKFAAIYCSKNYAEVLERVGGSAAELGGTIDQIRDYAKEKALLTDHVVIALHKLDPFPKNFKIKGPPVQKGDAKAIGMITWDTLALKDPKTQFDPVIQQLDMSMFNNVLALPVSSASLQGIELLKDGEAWKLNLPITPQWEAAANLFNERYKAYQKELGAFKIYMENDRYTPESFEADVLKAFRDAKPR